MIQKHLYVVRLSLILIYLMSLIFTWKILVKPALGRISRLEKQIQDIGSSQYE